MSKEYPVYVFEIGDIAIIYNKAFNKWCEENCQDIFEVTYEDYLEEEIDVDMRITFINEEDAMAFKLRWM